MTDPRTGILDAAETLFGDLGLAATSLRAITSAAGVNAAAVNYYFRSKDALFLAVCARGPGRINAQCVEMLERCERARPSGPLPLEEVIEAFVAPMLRAGGAPKLIGRIYREPQQTLPSAVLSLIDELAGRFAPGLQRALPDRDRTDLRRSFILIVGMLAQVMLTSDPTAGNCDTAEIEEVSRRIVSFACAGLRSLPPIRPSPDPSSAGHRTDIARSA